jgi:hypothetical protein
VGNREDWISLASWACSSQMRSQAKFPFADSANPTRTDADTRDHRPKWLDRQNSGSVLNLVSRLLEVQKADAQGLKPAFWRALAARLEAVPYPRPILENQL